MVADESQTVAQLSEVPDAEREQASLLTVVETIYYQPCQPPGDPVAFELAWTRQLATGEQVYRRQAVVGPEWQPLDCGWLAGKPVSLLLLQNEEGHYPVNPHPEERARVEGLVIEIGWWDESLRHSFQDREEIEKQERSKRDMWSMLAPSRTGPSSSPADTDDGYFESSISTPPREPHPLWFVPPRESFRGSPARVSSLWLRCLGGSARYVLTLFPG